MQALARQFRLIADGFRAAAAVRSPTGELGPNSLPPIPSDPSDASAVKERTTRP